MVKAENNKRLSAIDMSMIKLSAIIVSAQTSWLRWSLAWPTQGKARLCGCPEEDVWTKVHIASSAVQMLCRAHCSCAQALGLNVMLDPLQQFDLISVEHPPKIVVFPGAVVSYLCLGFTHSNVSLRAPRQVSPAFSMHTRSSQLFAGDVFAATIFMS